MEKILLCGYMASGKTTIAELLGRAAGLPSLDLDVVIEKEQGKTIPQIFKEEGEIKFRKYEHEALKALMKREEAFVLAFGGGTPCYANNHEFLKMDGVLSVYLKTGIPELINRLKDHLNERPLLVGLSEGELQEYVAKHLFDRSYFYHQAKHVVVTDGKSPEDIVNEIVSLI